jgi:hypothetical protein
MLSLRLKINLFLNIHTKLKPLNFSKKQIIGIQYVQYIWVQKQPTTFNFGLAYKQKFLAHIQHKLKKKCRRKAIEIRGE